MMYKSVASGLDRMWYLELGIRNLEFRRGRKGICGASDLVFQS
jgi:hypothetical protein